MSKQATQISKATATAAMANNVDGRIYVVNLLKRENGGLGFLIRQRDDMPYFSVWEIIKNGSAELNGKIRKGDLILKVNKEDLTNVSYERGLEILKTIKPGTIVELTMQSESDNKNDMSIKQNGGFMSPLQKFKKKFISCASSNTNSTYSNYVNFESNNNSNDLNYDQLEKKLMENGRISYVDLTRNRPSVDEKFNAQQPGSMSPSQVHTAFNNNLRAFNNHSVDSFKSPELSKKQFTFTTSATSGSIKHDHDSLSNNTSKLIKDELRKNFFSNNNNGINNNGIINNSNTPTNNHINANNNLILNKTVLPANDNYNVNKYTNNTDNSKSNKKFDSVAEEECLSNGLSNTRTMSPPKCNNNYNINSNIINNNSNNNHQNITSSNIMNNNNNPVSAVQIEATMSNSSSTASSISPIESSSNITNSIYFKKEIIEQRNVGFINNNNNNGSNININNGNCINRNLNYEKISNLNNDINEDFEEGIIQSIPPNEIRSQFQINNVASPNTIRRFDTALVKPGINNIDKINNINNSNNNNINANSVLNGNVNYNNNQNRMMESICKLSRENSMNMNQPQSAYSKNTIQIIQDGDDIRISIDGNIEILTNRTNDRKVISLSPQCSRKYSSSEATSNNNNNSNRYQVASNQIKHKNELINSSTNTELEVVNNQIEKKQKLALIENNEIKEDKIEEEKEEEKQIKDFEPSKDLKKNETEIFKTNEIEENKETKKETEEKIKEKKKEDIKKEMVKQESQTKIIEEEKAKVVLQEIKKNEEASQQQLLQLQHQQQQQQHQPQNGHLNEIASPCKMKKKKGTKLRYLLDESTSLDTLHHKSLTKVGCTSDRCLGSLLQTTKTSKATRAKDEIIEQATDFINQFYASVKREGSKTHKERLEEVIASIEKTGSYDLKETELCFGARTAWRNAPRCIGRIQWSKLQVFDARYVTTARGMFEAICNHLKYVTNKGNIRSAITIFRQRTDLPHDFRVWNGQFISYAGYKIDDQTVIGDRGQIEFTQICIKLGWKPKYTDFDLLPLVLQANGQDPEWFELSPDLIMEVELVHPKFDWFKELNLKWYCVPGVTSMMLDVGGLEFTACPFNGWYMGTEIGRDIADVNRYNRLPVIAEKMGLDIKSNSSLWRDKALVELNIAILHSFQRVNATIIDHFTASESFMKHYENENQLRGGCPADWVWVVPPLSSHLTPVFHLEMLNYNLKPSYEYQEAAWKSHVWKQKAAVTEEKSKRTRRRVYFSDIARAVKFSAKLMGKALARRVKCTILYATETGKSERFAKSLAEIFKHAFDAKVLCMKDYDVVDLEHETLLLMVTSTFGNGDPPENGEEFKKILADMRKEQSLLNKPADNSQKNSSTDLTNKSIYDNSGALTNVRFSVFALGNSSYPKFCSYGEFLNASLGELGADRIHEIGIGDELCGQEESFRTWSIGVYKAAVEAFCIDTDNSFIDSISKDDSWSPQTIRLTPVETKQSIDLCESLTKLHMRHIIPCKLVNRKNLQKENSGRVTLCVELSSHGNSGEMEYKPGDHVGIIAANRKEIVDCILAKITNAPPVDQLVKVEKLKEKTTVFGVSKQWLVDDRFPACSLRTAFTNLLDVTSPLTQKLFMYLSAQATNETERIQLEKLAKDHIAYEEWKFNGYPNLAETLDQFPSLRPHASLLITQLPKLQPRFYSISSSPKVSDEIHCTIGVVEYKVKENVIHYGVCSKWMDEISIGETIPTFIRGAPSFRLPDDKTCPIIMVGAGTGIAPFRSFWQERKIDMDMLPNPTGINGRGWGEMILYFGCRQSQVDELYRNEIDQLVKDKVITALYSAYSREPNKKKVYVQDLLAQNISSVSDAIFNKKGHFYVCGDVRMAADVTKTLELALHKHENMSLEEAKQYVNEMKENLRFHEDIFGNSFNISS